MHCKTILEIAAQLEYCFPFLIQKLLTIDIDRQANTPASFGIYGCHNSENHAITVDKVTKPDGTVDKDGPQNSIFI